ncbi:hypothetical protein ACLOJK_028221 [Asimina triloba]
MVINLRHAAIYIHLSMRSALKLPSNLRTRSPLDGSDFTIATHSSVLACWVERARLLAGLWIADCFGDGPAVAAHPPSCGILGRHGWLELEQWDGCAGFSDLASAQPDLMKRAVAKNCRWVSVSDLGPHGGAKIAIRAGRCGAAWNVGAWIRDIEDAGHGRAACSWLDVICRWVLDGELEASVADRSWLGKKI